MSEISRLYAKTPDVQKSNSVLRIQRTKSSQPIKSSADRILFLQRTIGNQAVQRLIKSGTLQTKLKIGQPGDKYEQEADRVADAVMRMPEPGVQREVKPEEEETLQSKPLVNQITPLVQVQRQEEPEEEEEIQGKLLQREADEEEESVQAKGVSGGAPAVSPSGENGINSIRGGGSPLPESTRNFFEPRFSADFSGVRVHTDIRAADLSKSINAKAFTFGNDVVFGAGQYAPESSDGKRLMTHELTHVLQQGRGKVLNKSVEVQAKKNGEQLSDVKNVIVIGSPSKNQRTKLQFVYAAMAKGGDKNTIWLVEQTGHNKGQREFIDKSKPGKLLWFKSTRELISHIKNMKNSSIGELKVFSHGTPSAIHLRYNHKRLTNYGFYLNNVRLLKPIKSKFISDAILSFDSCRAGAGKKKAMKKSLAQRISDVIGIPIKAWLGRTSYRLTNKCYKKKLKSKGCKVVGSQYSPRYKYYRWLRIATKDDKKERKARSKGHKPRELIFYPKKFMVTIDDKSRLINNPVYLYKKNKRKIKTHKWLKKGRVVEVLNKKYCNKWKKLTSTVGCWWIVLTTNIALGTKLPKMKKIKGWLLKDDLKKIAPQDVK